MRRRRPDLIVPIRDRRQRKRYLTLRNFRNAAIVMAIVFAAITIRSELRGVGPASYGRLYESELPTVEQKPVEVVTEAPSTPVVPDATHADPLLLAPAAREQWLHADTAAPGQLGVPMQRAEAAVATGETRVAIVGGAEGVTIVQQTRRTPVLSGGFGR